VYELSVWNGEEERSDQRQVSREQRPHGMGSWDTPPWRALVLPITSQGLSLFRIIQECLTNIHRHSGSKTASIRIVRDRDGELILEIRDEGRGISPKRLSEVQTSGSVVGIRGMRERILQFSGRMSIESDSSGTRIRVVIPTTKTISREGRGSDEPVQTAV
jgi:signal transduction histidine kinase